MNSRRSLKSLLFVLSVILISCKKEIIQYQLSVTSNPINWGTISPGNNSYEKGQVVSLLATPNAEYVFKDWSGSLFGSQNPATITMDMDKSVVGNFERRQYPLSLMIEGQGTVKEEVIAVANQSIYPSGTTVKLTAQPNSGWLFSNWAADLSGSTNPETIKIDKNKNITVVFKQVPDKDGDGIPDDKDSDNNTRKGAPVDANGVMLNPVYLDKNGVTIKAYDWAIVGDVGKVNNIEYRIVDRGQLLDLIKSDGNYDKVCTSKITDFFQLFWFKKAIKDITTFDVSNVKNMAGAFNACEYFNQDISKWDVSNVENMSTMFLNCFKFNQKIDNWNVNKVKNMYGMFLNCWDFNQDLSKWNVSNVNDMRYLFFYCKNFNGNISTWDISQKTDLSYMFNGCNNFNQDLSKWDVSNVKNMEKTFMGCINFNQNISVWNVKNVINMLDMFSGSSNFNQDLTKWDVTYVINCVNFSKDTNSWKLPKPKFTNCTP